VLADCVSFFMVFVSSFSQSLVRVTAAHDAITKAFKREQDGNAKLKSKLQDMAATEMDLRAKMAVLHQNLDAARKEGEVDRSRTTRLVADADKRVDVLQQDVTQKARQIDQLSRAMKELTEVVAKLRSQEPPERDKEPASSSVGAASTKELQTLRAENQALRNELSAFDVKFFDEIMELKYRHEQLQIAHQAALQKLKALEKA
jgi:cell division protein FtsB